MQELLQELERKPGTHKGENGRVGIVAGSADYTGAPAIAAEAALRTGCDLVRILTSGKISEVVASYSENFIVSGYPSKYFGRSSLKEARELADWADTLVVGPGMGDASSSALQRFMEEVDTPVVVDADAIGPALEADNSSMVFTPHSREAELIEQEYGSLSVFSEETGAVVLQKGPVDQVYSAEKYRNRTGTAAMTVGGTGDALAGVVGSLLSKGLPRTKAARLGSWINGKAGERAAERYGNGMLATDLVEEIPGAMWD
ncbi:MAG: NAD(P)H-hydrate dehydratase [Candidatus Nanohaloarchaea archaeon]